MKNIKVLYVNTIDAKVAAAYFNFMYDGELTDSDFINMDKYPLINDLNLLLLNSKIDELILIGVDDYDVTLINILAKIPFENMIWFYNNDNFKESDTRGQIGDHSLTYLMKTWCDENGYCTKNIYSKHKSLTIMNDMEIIHKTKKSREFNEYVIPTIAWLESRTEKELNPVNGSLLDIILDINDDYRIMKLIGCDIISRPNFDFNTLGLKL